MAASTILTDAVTEVQSGAERRSGCTRDRRFLESSVDDGDNPVHAGEVDEIVGDEQGGHGNPAHGLSAVRQGVADRLRPPGDGGVLRATPEQRAQRSMLSPS